MCAKFFADLEGSEHSQESFRVRVGESFRVRVGESLFAYRQSRIFLKPETLQRLKYNPGQTCASERMPSFKYSFTTLSSVISS